MRTGIRISNLITGVAFLCTVSGFCVAQEVKPCPGLRALTGRCANMQAVEDAQTLAMVITTIRSSYFGTPIGSEGGPFIPLERLFRDEPVPYASPTLIPLGPPLGP